MPTDKTVSPAMVTYDLSPNQDGSKVSNLRFHSVIVEAHEASTELTKFPVQTGFSVSNHAIRQNRRVVIEGYVSNVVIGNTATAYQYGTINNSRWMFGTLESLVNESFPCKVTTNLGMYYNVVFINFKTQQQEGMVDGMKFTLVGEEVQVKPLIPTKTIKEPVFQPLDGPARIAEVQTLEAVGFVIQEEEIIANSFVELGDGVRFNYKTANGSIKRATLEPRLGLDGVVTYIISTNETDNLVGQGQGVFAPQEEGFNIFALKDNPELTLQSLDPIGRVAKQIPGAVNHLTLCLVSGFGDIISGILDDLINTVFGWLSKKVNEAILKTVRAQSDDLGKILLGMALDCLVGTAIRTTGAVILDKPADTLFSRDQLLGIGEYEDVGIFDNESNKVQKRATRRVRYKLTKISRPVERRYPGSTNYGPYVPQVPSTPVP